MTVRMNPIERVFRRSRSFSHLISENFNQDESQESSMISQEYQIYSHNDPLEFSEDQIHKFTPKSGTSGHAHSHTYCSTVHMNPVKRVISRSRSFSHLISAKSPQDVSLESSYSTDSLKDQPYRLTFKSEILALDQSHKNCSTVRMNPVKRVIRRSKSLSHLISGNSLDSWKNRTYELTYEGEISNNDHDSSHNDPLEVFKDQIDKVTHTSAVSVHDHSHVNPLQFCKDKIHKFTHKSGVSAHDHDNHRHKDPLEVGKDHIHEVAGHKSVSAHDHNHENPFDFIKDRIHKLTHKSGGSAHSVSHENPLQFCKDQIHKLTHKSGVSAHDHNHDPSHEYSLDFDEDQIHSLTHRPRIHSHPSTDPLGHMPYHGSYGSLVRSKKTTPMSPIIEGLDLDFPDFGK